MKLDPWNDEDFWKSGTEGFVGESGQGQVVKDRNQSKYSNMKISYKTRVLYMGQWA